MKNTKNLPEEKLLQLIKEGKQRPGELPREAGATPVFPDLVINAKKNSLRLNFSYLHLKICMAVLLVFCALLLLKNLFLKPAFNNPIDQPPTRAAADKGREAPKNLDAYLGDSKPVFRVENSAPATSAGQAEAVLPDLIKDLNLLGIVSGENPQVVIEDKKNQQTYYLNKDQFLGEMKVADIQENKVILEYKDKRAELHL
jgi:type II secretory pathway component PulC